MASKTCGFRKPETKTTRRSRVYATRYQEAQITAAAVTLAKLILTQWLPIFQSSTVQPPILPENAHSDRVELILAVFRLSVCGFAAWLAEFWFRSAMSCSERLDSHVLFFVPGIGRKDLWLADAIDGSACQVP